MKRQPWPVIDRILLVFSLGAFAIAALILYALWKTK